MKSIFRIVAALALVGAIGGCAQLGIPSPAAEWRTMDAAEAPGYHD